MGNKVMSIHVPEETHNALRNLKKTTGIKISDFVRSALIESMKPGKTFNGTRRVRKVTYEDAPYSVTL